MRARASEMRLVFFGLVALNSLFLLWGLADSQRRQLFSVPSFESAAETPLILLSEQAAALGQVLTGQVTGSECIKLGPFTSLTEVKQLVVDLENRQLPATYERGETRSYDQYLVIVPPADSLERAKLTLARLQRAQIDSALLAEGEFANGISLGVFNAERPARLLRNSVIGQGFDAEMHVKSVPRKTYSVFVSPGQYIEKSKKTLASLGVGPSQVKISKASCEKIALGK